MMMTFVNIWTSMLFKLIRANHMNNISLLSRLCGIVSDHPSQSKQLRTCSCHFCCNRCISFFLISSLSFECVSLRTPSVINDIHQLCQLYLFANFLSFSCNAEIQYIILKRLQKIPKPTVYLMSELQEKKRVLQD